MYRDIPITRSRNLYRIQMPDLMFFFGVVFYSCQQIDVAYMSVVETKDFYIVKREFRLIERQRLSIRAVAAHGTRIVIKFRTRSCVKSKYGFLSAFSALHKLP